MLNIQVWSNIGHGLIVGWVEHPDIFCRVSLPPADQPISSHVFAVSETQQMAEDKAARYNSKRIELSSTFMGHYHPN